MGFKFSKRSLDRLDGVDQRLIDVARYAIKVTKVDFGVTEGLRTEARQRELFNSGASQTMNSKHISGLAIDVVAYIGPRISWELPLYCDIADAFKEGAIELGIPVKWGGAWTVPDIRFWNGSMHDALDSYIDTRRSQGKRPFIDGPHLELVT